MSFFSSVEIGPVYIEGGRSYDKDHASKQMILGWIVFYIQFTCKGLYLALVL